ncbi:putative metalloprotease [Methanofollis sp. W23]|uniref:RimK/LysX family protein n=1 Tax=Methanofollis sp. W23 TaxID=2817849 RepID=UPI001AE8CD4C|nr:RimK/LysX family protein [Methanofollis sp. W23]MBP2147155.1 putative metalloprotease [Methanofollis sp. W23]
MERDDDNETLRVLAFLGAEWKLAERFALPAEAFLPVFFSLRFGGAWSYAVEGLRAVSVVKKTTVYEDGGRGATIEEIYLLVDPEILNEEGAVARLEKCGEEPERLLVVRPSRVRLRVRRAVRVRVDPGRCEVSTEEVPGDDLTFEGSAAFTFAHEMEHLDARTISGKRLWEFRFV